MRLSSIVSGLLTESKASEMAHKLGLEYEGYGYWSLNGKIVAKTMNGYLVKLQKKDHEFIYMNDPKSDPARETNQGDDFNDPDNPKIHQSDYYTGEKSKSKGSSFVPSFHPHSSYGSKKGGEYGDWGGAWGFGGSFLTPFEDKPPKQPKFKKDPPMDGALEFGPDTTNVGSQSLNGIPLSSWQGAPEKPKKKWREEGKKEDVVKWIDVPGVNPSVQEPELGLQSGFKAAAGVVVMEPDGRVWVVEPTGHFAGYEHSFPKGTADQELTLQESAIKEAYEESGLQVEIVDYMGDVDRSMSMSRYYLARRVGGNPLDHGWETYAVKLVPTENLDKFLTKDVDQKLVKHIQENKDKLLKKVSGEIPPEAHKEKVDLTSDSQSLKKVKDLSLHQLGSSKGSADNIMFTQVGAQTGTNEGGFYIGKDGKKRYVKKYHEPEKSFGEVLTGHMLKELGLAAPNTQYFEFGKYGDVGFASEIVPRLERELVSASNLGKPLYDDKGKPIPGTKASRYNCTIHPELAEKILDGFAADCLMANWDVVGVNEGFMRNIVLVDDGSKHGLPVRIDNGGSFLCRGLNGRKPEHVLNKLDELQAFFKMNEGYEAVLRSAGYKKAEDLGYDRWKAQVSKIKKLHDRVGGWEKYVNKTIPDIDPMDKKKIVDMLYHRSKLLSDFAKSLRPPRENDTQEPK